ncbi:metal ABC transporter substrate-binding protein [Oribacterium sp. NK2B42]|uniref:metal ABC transporter substrate-binding protein n=1 Tax=Oribacterium sp. NK2B42 TaxID=689781 RepID=UPI00041FC136|nr:metal ABC transporter substrate-binding protein [Oribacterium sp. NK2B42]
MKKNMLSGIISFVITVSALAGCAQNSVPEISNSSQPGGASTGKVSIVCTSFPQYDWVCQLTKGLDDEFEITYLQNTGADLHSYQPSAIDIATIGSSDLFIYIGGESDSWVEGAIKNAVNPDLISISMMDALGSRVKEEELKEGMQEDDHDHDSEDHDHDDHEIGNHEAEEHDQDTGDHDHIDKAHVQDSQDHDHIDKAHVQDSEDHHHEESEVEYDEHVWLSLRNAEALTEMIADRLETLAPESAATVKANCDNYVAELKELDHEYETAIEAAPVKTIIFGDRFPFRYLVDDYNLDYYAAFVGCSAETEASFETISFLTNKVDELQVPAILTIENGDQKVAKTILNNTKSKNQQILVMDSIQSVSQEAINGGKTYLGAMEENLKTLKTALGLK